MPNGNVKFDVKYNRNSLPYLEPQADTSWITKANNEEPAQIPLAATTENVKQSVLPADAVTMIAKTGVNLSSATGITNSNSIPASARQLELSDACNQEIILSNLAKLENLENLIFVQITSFNLSCAK